MMVLNENETINTPNFELCSETQLQSNGGSPAAVEITENHSSTGGTSEGLVLRPSILPDEVAGVFTLHKIAKDTVLGPYIGEVVHAGSAAPSKECFSWQIYSPEDFLLYKIDASDVDKSNWMRYVNLATSDHSQNLSAFQHNGNVFYKATRDILPDEELLVWRAEKYNMDYQRKLYNSMRREQAIVEKKLKRGRPRLDKRSGKFQCDSCPYSTGIRNFYSNHLLSHIKNKAYTCDLCDASFAFKHVLEFHRTSHLEHLPPPSSSTSSFKCLRCSEAFESENALAGHVCSLQCDTCGAFMASLISLNNHKRIHQRLWPGHICDICGFESTTVRALWKHKNRRHASEVLKCSHCDVVCENKTALRYHSQQHSDYHAFKCDHCDSSFVLAIDLETHMKKHTDPKGYKCSMCDVSFTSQKALKKHYHLHVNERRLQCDSVESLLHYDGSLKCNVCGEVMESMVALNNHKRIHNRQGDMCHICDVCGFESTTIRALWLHKNRRHPAETLKCPECSVVCDNKSALRLHLQEHSHVNFFKCDQCDESFVVSSDFEEHKSKHANGEEQEARTLVCPICELVLESQKDLKAHIRGHVNECKLKCTLCGLVFEKAADLRVHKKTHVEERPYGCDVCGVSFAQKVSLQVHTRVHTGERPYKCSMCDATFAYHNSLYVHRRSHTGEKPYKCNVCDASFSQSSSLKGHLRTHTGEKPFRCAHCASEFSQRSSLKTHACVPGGAGAIGSVGAIGGAGAIGAGAGDVGAYTVLKDV